MGGALGERDGNRDSNAVAHQADAAPGMSSPNMPVRTLDRAATSA